MSKIGNKPIIIPKSVTITFADNIINIKGPKGESKLLLKYICPKISPHKIIMQMSNKVPKYKKYLGLYRNLVNNMIIGNSLGFEKKLIINGVGYRVTLENNLLMLSIGFSHIVYKKIPQNLSIYITNQNKNIIIKGNSKSQVGLYAAEIRNLRPPECYLGKGIRYDNEVINKKQGKSSSK